ncbi:polyprenyl synthetase family protein [Streptomyces sp. CC210A]|uniref:polyprenyl synthetase family protein n=1 Tax=Streptomyces sp. CC210A TaxID=2898184 RepID=UPI001F244C60|nr:polyprenyl synthetase family protein [Streptomyces sp. CC210A]
MRPTQAKDHPAAAPPPVPRLVAPPEPPRHERPDRPATGRAHARGASESAAPLHLAAPLRRVAAAHPVDPGAADVTGAQADPVGRTAAGGGTAAVDAVDTDVPAAVGRVLEQVLADRLARARALDGRFAQELAGQVAGFTQGGGKRTRSQLVWWAMRACGGSGEESATAALRIGAALELLQTCALVHDDVMDGSTLRRGRPALHTEVRDRHAGAAEPSRAARFGEAAAILAGDLALAWADDVVAELALDPWTATVVHRLWSDMRTEMVAGQFLDLQGQLTGSRSQARALRAACLKSALYSVERPLALGAAVAGAEARTLQALCSAGRCVGVAFQLRDDLDDVFGDPARTGKPAGGDIREGKPTYLVAVATARAAAASDRHALNVLDRALGDPGLSPAGLEEVREVLVRTGARAAVEARIGRLATQGLRHVDGAPLVPAAGNRLRELLAATASRAPGEPPARPHPDPSPSPAGSGTPEVRR